VSRTVTTQTELDAALAVGAERIVISSPAGVWLRLSNSGSSHVEAWDSSHVVAWGSSHVVAWGSSHVEAWDSSHVVAWGSSHVVAWDSSHVVAWDSSHVEARGSSHVEAWDSSHVEARGSSHVEAWDSSHVEARDSSHVEAAAYVAVHLHSQRVTLTGGVVIDMTAVDLNDTDTWLAMKGVKVTDGKTTLYKAVDTDLNAGQQHTLTAYPIGETVTAPDWRDNRDCGHGLHFGVTPSHAGRYFNGQGQPRYLAVEVDAESVVPLGDKAKAPTCRVLYEVDIRGRRVETAQVSA